MTLGGGFPRGLTILPSKWDCEDPLGDNGAGWVPRVGWVVPAAHCPFGGPVCCLCGGGLITGGRLSPSFGGGAFLTIVAPPCFVVAGIAPAPVESFAAGGVFCAGPFGLPVFSGRKLPSIALVLFAF